MFRWIVGHLNSRLCDETLSSACIGVLDLSALNKLERESNSFEAFLENITSERTASYCFKRHGLLLNELSNQGICQYQPNLLLPLVTAVNLVWQHEPNSMLSILDVECQRQVADRASLEQTIMKRLREECTSNLLSVSSNGHSSFTIKHHSAAVTYDLAGFVEANRSTITSDIISLFRGNDILDMTPSTNPFVRTLFSDANVVKSKLDRAAEAITSGFQSDIPSRRTSVFVRASKFGGVANASSNSQRIYTDEKSKRMTAHASVPLRTTDLDTALTELEETLDETEMWTVCCIAPSHDAIGVIDTRFVAEQLALMSVPRIIELVKLTQPFEHCYSFEAFVRSFEDVITSLVPNVDMSQYTHEMKCDAAVSALAMQGEQGIRQGPSCVFLSEAVWFRFQVAKHSNGQQSLTSPPMLSTDNSRYSSQQQSPSCTNDLTHDDIQFDVTPPQSNVVSNAAESTSPIMASSLNAIEATAETDSRPVKKRMSRQRCQWLCCTWSLTWWIPSFVLSCCSRNLRNPDVRMAWREKVALCILIFLMCCVLLFFIVGFGRILCPTQEVVSPFELAGRSQLSNPWVYAYGRAYQINDVISNHFNSYGIPNFRFAGVLGNDVSSLFFPGNLFSMYCPGLTPPQAGWDPLVNRPRSDANNYAHVGIDPKTGRQKLYLEFMNKYARARVGYSLDYIAKVSSTERRLIVIHDNVYDVSGYFNANSRFFGSLVEQLFGNFYGRDATAQWAQIQRVDPNAPQYINCLNNMFYIGTVDHRNDFRCQFSNYILLASSVFIVAIIGFKFLAALRCGSARDPEYHDKFVICQVPCYTEGAESLSKTLDSLSVMQYDDKRKLLFIIADGMVVGSGNDKPTPQIVLDLLGVDPASIEDTEAMSFLSLGEGDMQHNMAKVYSGLYQVQGHAVPFVVVVKVGKPSERVKPGNRGKRDSQLILMRFLSQVHFNAEMSPLELEIFHHMKNIIGVHPAFYEYVLMVDADTEVMPDSLNKLVSTMMHDSKIMGLCGETLLSNEKDSWITMIQ
eukprot:jgi/Hompol1/6697/HPOL_000417-RA